MAFTYKLLLEDGTRADPPTFTTAHQPWHLGDRVLIRPGVELTIVAVQEAEEPFRGTWVVAEEGD